MPDENLTPGAAETPSTETSQTEVPPIVTPPGGINAEQNVTLPAEVLQKILGQLDRQEKQLQANAADMAILRQSVSQGKLLEAENKAKPNELPKGYLKVFMGKTVIGWKTVKAETFSHPTNPDVPVGEVLKSTYYFLEGGDSGPVDQILFTRDDDRVNVRILSTTEEMKNPFLTKVKVKFEELITNDEDLKTSYKLPEGEIEVSLSVLNP